MSPDFKPGLRFDWTATVPARATDAQLHHDTPFRSGQPDVLACGDRAAMMALAGGKAGQP